MPEKQPEFNNREARLNEIPGMAFGDVLDELQQTAGPVQPELPAEPSEEKLSEIERSLTGDNFAETFSEAFRINEIQYKRSSLQHSAKLEDPDGAQKINRSEVITINQAVTYYEYFPSVVHDTLDIMRRYQALRASTPVVSPELHSSERQAGLYIAELEGSLAERTAFANVLIIDARLSKHEGDTPQLMKLREQYLSSSGLSATSKQVLVTGSLDAKWRQGNMLNQRIIDLLAGVAKIPGVDDGFLPQRMYLDLLTERYTQAFEEERQAVKDQRLVQAIERHEELSRKNEQAKEGKGEPLTEHEVVEYEKLRAQIDDRNAYMEGLSRQRKELQQEIFTFTDVLATDQMKRAELTTIQNQFGESFDFEGVSPPNPDRTPEQIQEAIAEQMEERSEFHLGRFDAFMGRFDEEVLDIGIQERVEDISNDQGREVVRRVNNVLANVLTRLLPESFGVRGAVREKLTQPLNDALGWPPGKDNWEELTSDEQEAVMSKAKSVLDAIQEFDRSKMEQFQGTVNVIRSMPHASTYLNEDVTEPLPTEEVTDANRDELIARYGGGTVYMMLFRQMDNDWDGFMGEYGSFLSKVNTTIDTHMEVGEAAFTLGNIYNDWKYYFLAAAIAAGFAAGAAARALYKTARAAPKLAWRSAKFGGRMTVEGTRATGRAIHATREGLGRIAQTHTAEELTKMRYLESERRVAQWMEKNTVGRAVSEKFARFRNTKAVRGTGKVVSSAAWVAVPAITAYEYYHVDQRADAVENDDDLKAEYESQKKNVLLEGGGVAASLAVAGFLPSVVLAAPVVYAGSHNRARSEVLANWKREVSSYATEFDSAGLREHIRGMTDSAAVEAGGGGTLRPRITLPSKKDQLEAFEILAAGNASARSNAYEAYFLQNLTVPQGTTEEQATRIINDKMMYLREVTDGGYDPELFNSVLQSADVFADLMQRRRSLDAAGEAPIISYEDEKGERQWIDLSKLIPGTGGDIRGLVGEYMNAVQPSEEVAMAITFGEMAKNRILPFAKEAQRTKSEGIVRRMVLSKLQHHIHQAEGLIRTIDWPGVDSWVSSGNTETQNIVRTYLAANIEEKLEEMIPQLLDGEMDPDSYKDALYKIETMMIALKNEQDTDAYAQTAGSYLKSNGLQPGENALEALLQPGE